MVDILDPAEVGAVRSTLDDTSTEAKRLDLLSDGFSLQSVEGIDFEVADLTLETTQLAADLAVVMATGGNLAASFDPQAFPAGSSVRELMVDQEAVQSSVELAQIDPRVMVATVQRDGRWYVSLGYTIAEFARQGAGVEFPTAEAVTPEGFDSPEAATTAMYTRLFALDLPGAIATAAPGEGDALARYASLWLPEVTQSTQQLSADGWNLSLESITYTTTGSELRKTVTPATFVVAGTVPASVATDDTGMPPLDPTLPTQIYLPSAGGNELVMIPAGEAVPTNITGIPTMTYEDVFAQYPDGLFNYTSATETGAVVPFAADPSTSPADEPLPIRVEGDGACTTISGAGAEGFFDPQYIGTWQSVEDGSWKSCDGSPFGVSSILALGIGGWGGLKLPAVATVEVDGTWYVSPVATVTGSVAQTLRSVSSADSLFDSPMAWYLYGTNRKSLEQQLTGNPTDSLSEACAAIVVSDPDGNVTGLVEGVTGPQGKACYTGDVLLGGGEVIVNGDDVTYDTTPAVPDTAPTAVTATTAG